MTNNIPKNKGSKLTLSERSEEIIGQLLEKYGLDKIQEEGLDKFISSQDPKERRRFFLDLPGAKLSKLVKEYVDGNITGLDSLSELIKEKLAISQEEAKNLTADLEKKIFIQVAPKENKEESDEIIDEKKKEVEPQKPDIYREPLK